MQILYASVNIYHHMIPLAESLSMLIGVSNFRYAVLKPPEKFRIEMGFSSNNEDQEWIIQTYRDESSYNEFVRWFENADIVMFSERALFKMAFDRINNSKLTFYFSERWFKPPLGKWRLLYPQILKYSLELKKLAKNKEFHYLAQGFYAAEDINYLGKFENRVWNWGYFTDVADNATSGRDNSRIAILWCGRMLGWKRVDTLIKAFSIIIKEYPRSFLTLIGNGPERNNLLNLAEKILPGWSYTFIHSKPTNEIRREMNSSDIFVLPSNGYEGWGAVINEAMAEGCAIIASNESGGGRSIIKSMGNGILFKAGNYEELSDKILLLLNDKDLLHKIKSNGRKSINNIWSPEIASSRFMEVCNALIEGKNPPHYDVGPMKQMSQLKKKCNCNRATQLKP